MAIAIEKPADTPVGAESVISVPSYVNTSPLDAPDCNPGILNEVMLVSPSVISFVELPLEGSAFLPMHITLLLVLASPPAVLPIKTLLKPPFISEAAPLPRQVLPLPVVSVVKASTPKAVLLSPVVTASPA